MEKTDLEVLVKRYETWELGMLIHLHLRKAQASAVPGVRENELSQAQLYYQVLKAKIDEIASY
jgi:hypothetical protein